MAQTDRFMIAPIKNGLETDLKPWLIPDDAFQELTNVYLFRGRVRKRLGTVLMNFTVTSNPQLNSRVRLSLGTTNGSGALAGTVPGAVFQPGQLFSIGDEIFTVQTTGNPVTMLTTGSGIGTYDTSTGAYVFTGVAISTVVYFYPATPIMGFANYDNSTVNNQPTFAFDTQFAYQYTGSAWKQLSSEATLGAAVWTGTDYDFFWSTNWRGTTADENFLYVTNYNFGSDLTDTDLMRYWDGTQWNFFNPQFDATDANSTIVTCQIIVPFHRRLVFLNVVENTGSSPGTNTLYANRARWSYVGNPVATDAFFENGNGNGGFLDAPTNEEIITAQFLKDRLMVYFDSSTWELVYTGNEIQPFIWQQLNTELGCESTFSQVPFDKIVLGVGNVGIHACNGSNVERIDNKIPDSVFNISNNSEGIQRVYGIRDYFTELVYWTFPSDFNATSQSAGYPNRILVYNYKTGSWSFFIDSITAFGYYQQQNAVTWGNSQKTWAQSNESWNSAVSTDRFRQIIAGNQQGFTFILSSASNYNEASLQITNIVNSGPTVDGTLLTITCYNHNLLFAIPNGIQGDYVLITDVEGMMGVNNAIYAVNSTLGDNTFTIVVPLSSPVSGTYTGAGVLSRVSNTIITTKQYNFYVNEGRNALINKVDFLVDKTSFGALTVDYSVSSSNQSLLTQGSLNGSFIGTGVLQTSPYDLVPLEQSQSRLWHPIYPLAEGECIQLTMYLKDDPDISNSQIRNINIASSGFELHAMTFYTQKTSSRLQ